MSCLGCGRSIRQSVTGYCKVGADCLRNYTRIYVRELRRKNRRPETRTFVKGRSKNQWFKDKLKSDPSFRACKNAHVRVNLFVRERDCNYSHSIGCTAKELKAHLEAQFKPGMSWENYGEWHVDHKYPLALAVKDGPEAFARACHYTNLQPLWAHENRQKGSRIQSV